MVPFAYSRPASISAAIASLARHGSDGAGEPGADFIAGGTDLIQLMQERVRNPGRIVDINTLSGLATIKAGPDGAQLGALVRMGEAAAHPGLRQHFPVVSEALEASASAQVRNLATLGGNLLQRTRCGYFRDVATPCNKREPGTGCPALDGNNRLHAILGTSAHCIATYAGDFANALMVLDATLRLAGPDGERTLPMAELHAIPGDTPHIETQLRPGEVILGIDIPPEAARRRSHYFKVMDRAKFEWSIASAAVALEIESDGTVATARVAVGGVATRPWRLHQVEAALAGRKLNAGLCRSVGALAADGAVVHGSNAYKVKLIQNTVIRALEDVGGFA